MKKQILLLWTAILLSSGWSVYTQTFSGGEGTEASPYLISSKEDMEELASYFDYFSIREETHFLLTRDLTGSKDTLTFDANSFYFSGIFDGGGHEIAVNRIGIFTHIQNATIKNLGVSGRITSNNLRAYHGYPSTGCEGFTGGICGIASDSEIINCYSIATILYTGNCNIRIGGICGSASNSNIINCYNSGDIEGRGNSSIGGICGDNYYNMVSHCFAANTVINSNNTNNVNDIGRILGNDYNNDIKNCYANSTMLINNAIASSEDATSKDGKDAPFSSFTNQSWIEENLGWDFDKVWKMSDINDPVYKGLPVLRKSSESSTPLVVSSGKSVTIYPNPVSTSFQIQGITGKTPLTITDISGKIVLKQTAHSNEIISVEHLPEGIYNIRVADETVKMVKK